MKRWQVGRFESGSYGVRSSKSACAHKVHASRPAHPTANIVPSNTSASGPYAVSTWVWARKTRRNRRHDYRPRRFLWGHWGAGRTIAVILTTVLAEAGAAHHLHVADTSGVERGEILLTTLQCELMRWLTSRLSDVTAHQQR